jgi:hypothetical protein
MAKHEMLIEHVDKTDYQNPHQDPTLLDMVIVAKQITEKKFRGDDLGIQTNKPLNMCASSRRHLQDDKSK